MKKNVGTLDRIIRVMIGLVLLGYAYQQGVSVIGIVVGILGIAVLLTGLFSFCWLYTLLGVNTCKKDIAMETKPMTEQTEMKTPDMPEQNQRQDQ